MVSRSSQYQHLLWAANVHSSGCCVETELTFGGEYLLSGLKYLLCLGLCSTGSSGGRSMNSFLSLAITSLEDSPTVWWTGTAASPSGLLL